MISKISNYQAQTNQNHPAFKARLNVRGDVTAITKQELKELTDLVKSVGLHKDDVMDVYIGWHHIASADCGIGSYNKRNVAIASYLDGNLRAGFVSGPTSNNEAFCEAPYKFIKNEIINIQNNFLRGLKNKCKLGKN